MRLMSSPPRPWILPSELCGAQPSIWRALLIANSLLNLHKNHQMFPEKINGRSAAI